MVSPVFDVCPKSRWRDSVVDTWKYLRRRYFIEVNQLCSTHIHISLVPSYTLTDLKRIACSAIYFEPAFEALVPKERRGNIWAKSNWLDNPRLAQRGVSRLDSMTLIERAGYTDKLIESVQGKGDRDYAWNFESLIKHDTIEFRKPPASLTPGEALSWAELAMNFVQASTKYGTSERLQKIPSTVQGLRWLLRQAEVPGMNEPQRLQRIWGGKDANAAMEPESVHKPGPKRDVQMEMKLKQMSNEDIKRIRAHAKSAKEPYWGR
jgi:Putative amidoligase enzyme